MLYSQSCEIFLWVKSYTYDALVLSLLSLEERFVFGSTGKIGSHITKRLIDNDYSVTTVGRRKSEFNLASHHSLNTLTFTLESLLISLLPTTHALVFFIAFALRLPLPH